MTKKSYELNTDSLINPDKRFNKTLFFVEVTDNEYHKIWEEYRFEQDTGIMIHVGNFGGMPVSVTFQWVKIDGEYVCLFEPTSQVVHHPMIEEWILKCVKSKRRKNFICDARNFQNAVWAIEEKTGRKVKKIDFYRLTQWAQALTRNKELEPIYKDLPKDTVELLQH